MSDQKPFAASKGQATTDHAAIRRWAEARGARPAAVRDADQAARPIHLVFPDGPAAPTGLEAITWDEWFAQFDAHDLALLVEEMTSAGEPSNFCKLVSR
jgi:hypothetical protein